MRHRTNLVFHTVEDHELPPIKHQDILKDEIIELDFPKSKEKYPKRLRRICVYNEEHKFVVELLTNNFELAASTISELYKARWNIEIFFRNIKQLFHIKSFVGTSRNAVEIQIWTALITMLLFSYLRSIAEYPWHLSNLVHSIRLNTFTKIDLRMWINNPLFTEENDDEKPPGGMLFQI